MGVRGFLSFLKINGYYLADRFQISNTTIVIDANNLLCQLYSTLCLDKQSQHYKNDVYGGDFVGYGAAVREFFTALEKCNITAVLVFDGSALGSRDLDGIVASKEKEVYRRGLDKFMRAKGITEYDNSEELLLPQTLNITFRNILDEFGIQRIQTPYEADSHIARVANELNCPVLTNDSDFIIYSLKRGFLLFDYFDYKSPVVDRATGKAKIMCMLYSQDKLVKSNPGLNRDCMPLLSILLGNDYVEASVFENVMKSVCKPQYNGHLQAESFNHRRIGNIMSWMRGRSLEECISQVLEMVHHTHRAKLERLIKFFMRSYHIEIEDDFVKELERYYPSNRVDDSLRELNLTPATYLRYHLENSDLSSLVLDIVFHNTHYNYSIADDFTLPSSSWVKFRPISLALALLRPHSYLNMSTYRRAIQTERDVFRIYDRIENEYSEVTVRPMDELENFGSLIHIDCYSMITLEPALKRSMLMACFRFSQEELNLMNDTVSQVVDGTFAQEASLCFLLLKYVGLETKMPPKPQFVNALMITIFYYAALSGNLNKNNILSDNSYGQLLLKMRPHATTNNGKTHANKDQRLYRRIVHFISQLQAAYKSYFLVNTLLDHALFPPRLERFFNSNLIFRFTKFFYLKEITLDEICKDLPTLLDVCESLRTIVLCAMS